MMTTEKPRALSKKELCQMYNVSRATFSKWIREINHTKWKWNDVRNQRILTPVQVAIIFDHLGEPVM